MAISARVDSDMCRWRASAANLRFSCGVGRAVIVGAIDFKAPSFTAHNPELQQNADTSLSCHHSNQDPTTPLDPKSFRNPIREYGPKTLHESLSVLGLSFALFSTELAPSAQNSALETAVGQATSCPADFRPRQNSSDMPPFARHLKKDKLGTGHVVRHQGLGNWPYSSATRVSLSCLPRLSNGWGRYAFEEWLSQSGLGTPYRIRGNLKA